jgi:hypothetical protein
MAVGDDQYWLTSLDDLCESACGSDAIPRAASRVPDIPTEAENALLPVPVLAPAWHRTLDKSVNWSLFRKNSPAHNTAYARR